MSNKRYQLLVQWNGNYVEALPQVKASWIDLVEHAKRLKKVFTKSTIVHFLEWEDGDPNSLSLGKFTEKVLEDEDDSK